jgi:hypothetical protein
MADAQWGQHLPAMSGLPLLLCGAGTDRKAPIEPGTGLQMADDWSASTAKPGAPVSRS